MSPQDTSLVMNQLSKCVEPKLLNHRTLGLSLKLPLLLISVDMPLDEKFSLWCFQSTITKAVRSTLKKINTLAGACQSSCHSNSQFSRYWPSKEIKLSSAMACTRTPGSLPCTGEKELSPMAFKSAPTITIFPPNAACNSS